jgi:hypothetical protein
MDNELSYSQQEELKNKIRKGDFDAETEINNLIKSGFEEQKAKEELLKVIKNYKEDLFYEAKEAKENEEKGNIAVFAVIFSSLLIAMFGGQSGIMVLVSLLIACLAGFYGFPKNPIPAVVGFAVGAIIMPFAVGFYLRGRDTFLNLELFIPMIMAFGPAFLIKYILSKLIPAND